MPSLMNQFVDLHLPVHILPRMLNLFRRSKPHRIWSLSIIFLFVLVSVSSSDSLPPLEASAMSQLRMGCANWPSSQSSCSLKGVTCEVLGQPPQLHVTSLNTTTALCLCGIPPSLNDLTWLHTLDLSGTYFQGSVHLAALVNLKRLSLRGMRAEFAPIAQNLGFFNQLVFLELTGEANSFQPPILSIPKLPPLVLYLDLSGCALTTVPSNFGILSQNLNFLGLPTFRDNSSPSLTSFSVLNTLVVSNIPSSTQLMSQPPLLKAINLRGGTSIPPALFNLPNIVSFTWEQPNYDNPTVNCSLPESFLERLEALKIDMNCGELFVIPPTASRLRSLSLNGFYNGVNKILTCYRPLWEQLEVISLNYVDLLPCLAKMPDFTSSSPLRHLSLVQSGSGTIPKSIGLLKLETFQLLATGFDSLPNEVWNISSLTSFNTDLHTEIFPNYNVSYPNLTLFRALRNVNGSLPEASRWPNLETLFLYSQGINGTIPPLPSSLISISLWATSINGTIPSLNTPYLTSFSSLGTMFSGPIPTLQNTSLQSFIADNNMLEYLPEDIPSTLSTLQLSHNRLGGTIPSWNGNRYRCPSDRRRITFDLSYNQLVGTIPGSILTIATSLSLNDNKLEFFGKLDSESLLTSLDVTHNRISGTLPALSFSDHGILRLSNNSLSGQLQISAAMAVSFEEFRVDHNQFEGPLPIISVGRGVMDVSWNHFNGCIAIPTGSTAIFDFSHNQFTCFGSSNVNFGSGVSPMIDLSFNLLTSFSGALGFSTIIDISNNKLSGPLSCYSNCAIQRLLLDNNIGIIIPTQSSFPLLTYLSIDDMKSGFDVQALSIFPSLSTISARSSKLTGTLKLTQFKSLQSFDLTGNLLNGSLDPLDFSSAFTHNLRSLSLRDNPLLPSFHSIDPSIMFSGNVAIPFPQTPHSSCFEISFTQSPLSSFFYDESLFSYLPCHCDAGWYGLVPVSCYICPIHARCDPTIGVNVPEGYYLYSSLGLVSSGPLLVEPCCGPNCLGVNSLKFSSADQLSNTSWVALVHQCANGSQGRICAECTCNDAQSCYYDAPSGECVRCSFVFTTTQAVVLIVVLILMLMIACIFIARLVLVGMRRQSTTHFKDLPLLTRLGQRLQLATSTGYVVILVTFLQMSSQLNTWDVFQLGSLLNVLNAQLVHIGFRCLLPTTFTQSFIINLAFPFIILVLLLCCLVIANALSQTQRDKNEEEEIEDKSLSSVEAVEGDYLSSHSSFDDTSMLLSRRATGTQNDNDMADSISLSPSNASYVIPRGSVTPELTTTAIVCQTCFGWANFVFLGVTMTALQPFFRQYQAGTGTSYMMMSPWMPYDQGHLLRMLSLPVVIGFVALLPLAFIVVTIIFYRRLTTPLVSLYAGRLFSLWHPSYAWWGILQVGRKILLSVSLLAFPWSPLLTSSSAFVVLLLYSFIQSVLQPWKRHTENILDVASSLLLLTNLLAPKTPGDYAVSILMYIVNAGFIVATLACLLRTTSVEPTPYELLMKGPNNPSIS